MSKFKSFAEKGSFGGSYIKLPDETQKFKESRQRALSKMDRAQSFLQRTREGYLSAQKEAQRIETDQREANEKRQRQARQEYIDILKRDAEIENANTQADIQKQEQLFNDLAQFSVTAYKTFTEIKEAQRSREIDQANAIILQTGLTYEDALAFQNIDKTFTDQEAFATDEGQRILDKVGDTPEIRSFLAKTRDERASAIYVQNKQLILNQVNTELRPYLDAALINLPENASPSRRLAEIDLATGRYVRQFNLDPKMLEGLVGDRIRAIKNNLRQTQQEINTSNEKAAFREQRFAVFNSQFGPNNDGAKNVLDYVTTNPSRQKNTDLVDWATNMLGSGNMSPDVFYDMFYAATYDRDGKQVTFNDQFKGTQLMLKVKASYDSARSNESRAWNAQFAAAIVEAEKKVMAYFDNEAIADGYITRAEENKMQELIGPGIRLEQLPIYNNTIKFLTNDARAGVEFMEQVERLANNDDLTQEFIDRQVLPNNIRQQAQQYLDAQEARHQDKNYKGQLLMVKNLARYDGKEAVRVNSAYNKGLHRTNIDLYTAKLVDMFNEQVKILGSSEQAGAYVRQWHMTRGGGVANAFDINNGFKIISQEQTQITNEAIYFNREVATAGQGIADFYKSGKDPNKLVGKTGDRFRESFTEYYSNPSKGIPQFIKNIAEDVGVTGAELMFDLGQAFDLPGEYQPGAYNFQEIKKSLDVIEPDFRLNNTYRYANERNARAFNTPSAGRGKFAGQVYGEQLTQLQMAQVAARAGFTPEQARVMSAIGMGESKGFAKTDTVQSGLDPNKENEYSIGIFQVNVLVHKDKLDRNGFTEEDMRDPYKNAIIAKEIFDERAAQGRDGYEPWSVYTNGNYQTYMENFTF